jgi:hypothetical protein
MHVDPAEPAAHEHAALDEHQDFVVGRNRHDGQRCKEIQDLGSLR